VKPKVPPLAGGDINYDAVKLRPAIYDHSLVVKSSIPSTCPALWMQPELDKMEARERGELEAKPPEVRFESPVPAEAGKKRRPFGRVTPTDPRLLDRDRNVDISKFGGTRGFYHLPTGMTPRRNNRERDRQRVYREQREQQETVEKYRRERMERPGLHGRMNDWSGEVSGRCDWLRVPSPVMRHSEAVAARMNMRLEKVSSMVERGSKTGSKTQREIGAKKGKGLGGGMTRHLMDTRPLRGPFDQFGNTDAFMSTGMLSTGYILSGSQTDRSGVWNKASVRNQRGNQTHGFKPPPKNKPYANAVPHAAASFSKKEKKKKRQTEYYRDLKAGVVPRAPESFADTKRKEAFRQFNLSIRTGMLPSPPQSKVFKPMNHAEKMRARGVLPTSEHIYYDEHLVERDRYKKGEFHGLGWDREGLGMGIGLQEYLSQFPQEEYDLVQMQSGTDYWEPYEVGGIMDHGLGGGIWDTPPTGVRRARIIDEMGSPKLDEGAAPGIEWEEEFEQWSEAINAEAKKEERDREGEIESVRRASRDSSRRGSKENLGDAANRPPTPTATPTVTPKLTPKLSGELCGESGSGRSISPLDSKPTGFPSITGARFGRKASKAPTLKSIMDGDEGGTIAMKPPSTIDEW